MAVVGRQGPSWAVVGYRDDWPVYRKKMACRTKLRLRFGHQLASNMEQTPTTSILVERSGLIDYASSHPSASL
jgi:hypothetical protein